MVDQPRLDEFIHIEKMDLISQEFKVTKSTSFEAMKEQALRFWGLLENQDEFTLVLPNMHEIMCLNGLVGKTDTHEAYSIQKYFEIHRDKKPLLYLIRPQKTRRFIF